MTIKKLIKEAKILKNSIGMFEFNSNAADNSRRYRDYCRNEAFDRREQLQEIKNKITSHIVHF